MLRTDVILRFVPDTACYTRVIMRTSADAFPVVGGRCTGGGAGARPSRAVVVSPKNGKIYLVTMTALCLRMSSLEDRDLRIGSGASERTWAAYFAPEAESISTILLFRGGPASIVSLW
jgi:hypothetical protein